MHFFKSLGISGSTAGIGLMNLFLGRWPRLGLEPRRWRSLCVSPKGGEDFRIVLPLELF
jgi:hypothetical protein